MNKKEFKDTLVQLLDEGDWGLLTAFSRQNPKLLERVVKEDLDLCRRVLHLIYKNKAEEAIDTTRIV